MPRILPCTLTLFSMENCAFWYEIEQVIEGSDCDLCSLGATLYVDPEKPDVTSDILNKYGRFQWGKRFANCVVAAIGTNGRFLSVNFAKI